MKVLAPMLVPRAKPRNPILAKAVSRLISLGTRRHTQGPRRARDFARLDLDQRVREVGEW